MTTRGDMLTEIKADTGRTNAAQTLAMQNKIAAAIRHYAPKRFWFNESRSVTFNTVAGTDTYTFATIGTVFYQIDELLVTFAAGDVRELTKSRYMDFEAHADSQTANNQPSEWAYINKAIRFNYAPDAIYAVRLTGHIKIAGPTDDVTDNDWMTDAYDLIMCRAKAELYAHKWEDPANAALMVQAEASALKVLQDATRDKVATGFIEATDF